MVDERWGVREQASDSEIGKTVDDLGRRARSHEPLAKMSSGPGLLWYLEELGRACWA